MLQLLSRLNLYTIEHLLYIHLLIDNPICSENKEITRSSPSYIRYITLVRSTLIHSFLLNEDYIFYIIIPIVDRLRIERKIVSTNYTYI